ncbi:MAG: hypothetical protein GQE15_22865 [Archangiaceae bacterium]|nr:hypothetical protein [Archangiaceae bacterium]
MKNTRPTPVRVGIMERRRPELVSILPIRHLSLAERLWRSAKRSLIVMGSLLLVGNAALILFPAPHIHLCLFPIACVLGPIIAIMSWQDRVLFPQVELPCPRCQKSVTIPEGIGGWPARFNCDSCAAMVELNEA